MFVPDYETNDESLAEERRLYKFMLVLAGILATAAVVDVCLMASMVVGK